VWRITYYEIKPGKGAAELDEKDKAFATLNESIDTKDQHTAWMKVDPYMDPLRDDLRFRTG
jgi:hypothetical protein